jgi:hypothetical protein
VSDVVREPGPAVDQRLVLTENHRVEMREVTIAEGREMKAAGLPIDLNKVL